MKRITTIFALLIMMCMSTWATVTQPTLTTDPDNPTYYVIKNFRSNKYASFAGASAQLAQESSIAVSTLWYFVANGDGVSIVPAADPTLKLASTNSATADGAIWYTPENPYNAGTFCVSLTSGATANCWDDQGGHTTIGYWQPAATDYAGTSWYIEEIPATKAEVDGGNLSLAIEKHDALVNLAPLSGLSVYNATNLSAVKNAANSTALNTALEAFNANISLLCRSGKYLVVGASACSYVESPTGYEEAIQLESAGNGTFYLKGYKSEKYIGDVAVSTAIGVDATPTKAFYFQVYNGYTVVRPSDTSASYDGYRYIHNGGSGCVGWEANADNSEHTIAEVTLPSAMVNITYHLMVNGVDKAQETIECGVGDAPDASGIFVYPYTTFTYDVTEIAATTTDVYATAVFNMPFTASTDYASATWYYATLREKYLRADDTKKDGSGRYQTNASNERTDAYRWAFFGNPIEGIYVMNKNQGDGKYLYQDTQFNFTSLADPTADSHALFAITSNSNGGFTLRSISGGSTYYVNDAGSGGNLGFWNSASGANDGGSNWLVEEAVTSDKNALASAIAAAQALVASAGVPGYLTTAAATTLSDAITVAQGVHSDPAGDYASAYNTLVAAINTAEINYIPRTDVYYTITSSRGSMVYDPTHDSSTDADNNNYLWYTTSLDNTNVNHLWGFIEQGGKYYMYNVGRKQFATVSTTGGYQYGDKGTWVFSDTPAYVTFDAGINNSVAIPDVRIRATVATTGNTYSMSISTGYTGPVITYDAQGDGGIPMRIATSAVAVDAAITAEMTAKVEDITPYRNALKDAIDACALIPVGDGLNQYASNSTYTDALAAANTTYNNASATKAELQQATQDLENAISGLMLNLPTAGFYRIKGKTSSKYLAAENASNGKYNMSDATDATTIFYFDGTKLTNFGSGMSNGMTATNWAWVIGDNASTVVFQDGQTNGGYAIQSATAYFYDNGAAATPSADRGGSLGADARYRSWYLETVDVLPVKLNDIAGTFYATLCLPVDVTLAAEANAYTIAVNNEKTEAVQTMVAIEANQTTKIPANTPVVLEGTASSVDATINTTGTAFEPLTAQNDLTGTLAAIDVTNSGHYFLGKGTDPTSPNGVVPGFFHWQGTVLKGFRAYLDKSLVDSSTSKGLTLVDGEATGINGINAEQAEGQAIYNLQGQRVNKAQRGLYIVNGKKVVVK